MTVGMPKVIVVIGAARSGTKIIRDSLAMAADAGAVPYDVGFVWRYGNESSSHDGLFPDAIKPKTQRLVRSYVAKYARNGVVIEKTVGNTLRVPFVAALLPEARFVYVERDGVDVSVSTMREWLAESDYRYLAKKLKHFPVRLLSTYGVKFARAQTVGRDRKAGHVGSWGPRYPGIDADLARDGLLRVCARQWRESVTAARRDLGSIDRVVKVQYKDLVDDAVGTLTRVLTELELPVAEGRLTTAAAMIDPSAAHPARPELTASERSALSEEIAPLLKELGYDPV